jgi:hypothetical protein
MRPKKTKIFMDLVRKEYKNLYGSPFYFGARVPQKISHLLSSID